MYLRVDEAAEKLGVPPGILSLWKKKGRGPDFKIVGKRVLYLDSKIEEFRKKILVEFPGEPKRTHHTIPKKGKCDNAWIQERLLRLGKSQIGLCKELGRNQFKVSRLLNGLTKHISMPEVEIIADYLEADIFVTANKLGIKMRRQSEKHR